ncbi:ankyrin repeat-containing domain protein [Fusarium tricinctum]|uniref:Ankyrin repeat-containing domain protein n=1 Tax=Fusarium tricinctum TaxID=61284 RepID=A0A8K0RZM0_9HYPO|nr:ankyrin repeat-containing domain protein [Fusarium tricinctum]
MPSIALCALQGIFRIFPHMRICGRRLSTLMCCKLVLVTDMCTSQMTQLKLMLTLAVICDSPESIEILLKLWENIPPCQGLPRQTGHYIKKYGSQSGSRLKIAIGKVMEFVNDWDDVGLTQLHIAAAKGDVLPALREEPWVIEQFDETGRSPIHFAVANNNFNGLEQLIQAEADINQRDVFGYTPLMISAFGEHELMVQKLLEYKECRRLIDKVDDIGETALHHAIRRSWPKCVWLLLDAGASTSKLTSNHKTCLHILASSYDSSPQAAVEIFHHLRTQGSNLEARDRHGSTPILTAILSGNVTVFNTLTSAGASLNVSNSNRQNIFWLAACSRDYRIIDHLAKQNLEDIDPRLLDVEFGTTALGSLYWFLVDPYPIPIDGRPNPGQQQAFIRLYFKLLIRDLKCLMSILKEVCSAAAEKDAGATIALLDILIKKNENSFRHDHAGWYSGLQVYVKDGKWDPLAEAISEEYDETSEKLWRAHIARGKTIEEPEMREFFYA